MMKLELDTLKCVTMLVDNGVAQNDAKAIIDTLSSITIRNLYEKSGVDNMLSETVQKVFDENRRELDRRIEERRRETEARFALSEKRMDQEIAEARSRHRWMIGTIITCTVALAGYLSALIQMTH